MLILVCEDESQYQERIQGMIDRWINTCGYRGIKTLTFSSSEYLLNEYNKGLKADILFLDILFQIYLFLFLFCMLVHHYTDL